MSVDLRPWPMMICLFVATSATAQDSAESRDAKAKQERWDRQFQESLGWYQFRARPDSGAALKPLSILRWANPTRGQKGEPTLVLWTDQGRPAVLSGVYPWNGFLIFEVVSLARSEGLTGREGDRVIWSPRSPGVTFRDVPEAPTPADIPLARLQQMRGISERFKLALTGTTADGQGRESLRLLPKPIHRYDLKESKAAHPDLVDGAVFAFVQGTDPEAVLLVEAIRRGERTTWHYAFARATGWAVEAKLGDSVVWTVSGAVWNDPKSAVIILGKPLVE